MADNTLEWSKVIIAAVSAVVGLTAILVGVYQFIQMNMIRRYEKFHEMTTRFDDDADLQDVCAFLHDPVDAGSLTKQQREVFICFIEEVHYMMNAGLMKPAIALNTFGYYAMLADKTEVFWTGLNRSDPFYIHFNDFCIMARQYQPENGPRNMELAF